MSARGRRATLPPEGFRARRRLCDEHDGCVARFVAEDHGAGSKEYDFAALPISPALRKAFAQAFAQRIRPGGGLRALGSVDKAFRRFTSFANYLGGLMRPPTEAGHLTPTHLDGWFLQRSHLASGGMELSELKASLRKVPGISGEFAAKVSERGQRREKANTVSYSRAEFDRILGAARGDVRRAARRIRANQELLARWRTGGIDREQDEQRWLRGQVLDMVDRHADVPRYTSGAKLRQKWVGALDTVTGHITALHLGSVEVAAFVVLLVGLTGENRGTIVAAPAAHHRPDGYVGPIGTVILELDKPRRGPNRHMDVPLVDLPDWIPISSEHRENHDRDDLRTPFGVYMLAHELTTAGRRILGTERLLVWWAATGNRGVGSGLRTGLTAEHVHEWAAGHDLPADRVPPEENDEESGPGQLTVTLPRLRLTHTELHQKAVAHTESTLANEYLLRNRGNIADYQRVVADVLTEQVAKARTHTVLRTLSPSEIEQARSDPDKVAARHNLDAATLRRMVSGELDTVMAACVDNLASPHTPAGQPCRASFMLCLSCPCARALPHHLPLQVAVHDTLQSRQAEMTPLRWAQRFSLPHAQLADLLERTGTTAVDDARAHLADEQRQLVERFLRRELDLL
jgi:hypothetical protein